MVVKEHINNGTFDRPRIGIRFRAYLEELSHEGIGPTAKRAIRDFYRTLNRFLNEEGSEEILLLRGWKLNEEERAWYPPECVHFSIDSYEATRVLTRDLR